MTYVGFSLLFGLIGGKFYLRQQLYLVTLVTSWCAVSHKVVPMELIGVINIVQVGTQLVVHRAGCVHPCGYCKGGVFDFALCSSFPCLFLVLPQTLSKLVPRS